MIKVMDVMVAVMVTLIVVVASQKSVFPVMDVMVSVLVRVVVWDVAPYIDGGTY